MIQRFISIVLYPLCWIFYSTVIEKIRMFARSFFWSKKINICGQGVWFDGVCQIKGEKNITIGSNSCFGADLFLTSGGGR